MLFLTVQAESDLSNISNYTLKAWGEKQQIAYLQMLEIMFDKLSENIFIGEEVDYILTGYRKYPAGKHLIFYKIVNDTNVEVVRVLHQSMDLDERLDLSY